MKLVSDKNKEYWEWLNKFNTEYWPANKHLRKGQALFNFLFLTYSNIADNIRSSKYDCYYNDVIIPNTLEYLKNNWENLKITL